ncbi:hypothetical protein J437_LFUL004068, partial [Ladona fulva]
MTWWKGRRECCAAIADYGESDGGEGEEGEGSGGGDGEDSVEGAARGFNEKEGVERSEISVASTVQCCGLWEGYVAEFGRDWPLLGSAMDGMLRALLLSYWRFHKMSATSQIQMAPQGSMNSGQAVHSQDSNMSTGSSHSDKDDNNTPEKLPRTPTERKRKRKVEDIGGSGNVGGVVIGGGGKASRNDGKKINEYFAKHSGNSPIRHGSGGAKSPSPQQSFTALYPPSPQGMMGTQPSAGPPGLPGMTGGVQPVVPPEFSTLMHPPRIHPTMVSKLVQ